MRMRLTKRIRMMGLILAEDDGQIIMRVLLTKNDEDMGHIHS